MGCGRNSPKGNVLNSCVDGTNIKTRGEFQVCDRVRRIVGVKRAVKRIGGETLAKKADAQNMEGREGGEARNYDGGLLKET